MRTPGRYFRELWTHLKTEHTSSGRLVAAVGVGVFIGTLPFYGFHFFICVAVAWLFGLNKVTTYLAANISNPIVSPFLIFGSVQLGERMLHGSFLSLTVEGLEHAGPARFFGSWLAGGVALGALLGLVGGALTFAATTGRRRRERAARAADPFMMAHSRTAPRYLPCGRVAHGYVKRKLLLDPVYRSLVDRIAPDASVLDVGCGRGQFAVLLALMGPARSVKGLDWDARKIDMARTAAQGLARASFEVCDLSRGLPREPAAADAVLLIDVLHYLEPAAQDALLSDLATRLGPSGTLFVRDVDAAAGWRYRVTALEERIFTGMRFNRGRGLHFRPIAEMQALLEGKGLVCKVQPMWQGTPFANVLLTATR
ncbi:MAG: DUF2062 domain-containing protein [Deltaproteobacteria bacterium]|nr:DUF2062 domain-containing protein [Deltaproteobacteria bacterium]